MNKAIFLDRDGTIIIEKDHIYKIEDLELIQNVVDGLKLLPKDYALIIITNQAGIGKGLYTKEDYLLFRDELTEILNKQGIKLSGEYFCPHNPVIGCNCRKPKIGMLEQAASDFNLNLENCWLIGDKSSDILAGKNAGCRTIHVLTGQEKNLICSADFTAKDLIDAAHYIMKNS